MPWLYMYNHQFTFIGPLKLNEEYEKSLMKIEIFKNVHRVLFSNVIHHVPRKTVIGSLKKKKNHCVI